EMARAAEALRVGDPLDLQSQAGAVNNAAQLNANLGFVAKAEAEGAEIVTGGARILEETGGLYMAPTIATGVKPQDTLFQQEVFGPVLAVTAFDREEEAVALANGTAFGLAGGLWTRDLSRAHRMIAALKTGVVHVNTYGGPDVTVPLGGVKQSGNGHDKSLHAFDKYIDLKTAWIKL
ncbi:MAG: aldehyde dehydrogenase family protein, partial [Pseudomonadota bacterium]